jgi:hypothetical protein
MPTILPGFAFDRSAARYRDLSRGQFVSRTRVLDLMESQVNRAEDRLGQIIQGLYAKEIAPGYAQTLMRDELRRLTLQNIALGKGGLDRLDFADYGRAGRQLRDSYQRMNNLVRDVESGKVSLAQALNRVEGYTLDARRQFFAAEREAARQSGRAFEERRTLHARESCVDCIGYAAQGWVAADTLPLPGTRSRCGSYCRCTMERREITPEMMRERMTARLERMMA